MKKCDGIFRGRTAIDTSKTGRITGSDEKNYEMTENEEGVKLYQCIHCQKTFEKRPTFYLHFYKIHKEKILKCDKCIKTFSIPSLLKEHQNKCHNRIHKENKHKCDKCSKMFWRKLNLEIHSKQCDGTVNSNQKSSRINSEGEENIQNQRFKCVKCQKSFSTNMTLNRHFKNIHESGNYGTKKCESCEKVFSDQWLLNKHLMSHAYEIITDDRREIFKCKKCEETFDSRIIFEQHFYKHHPIKGMKTYQCSICKKFCSDSWKLKVHLKTCDGTSKTERIKKSLEKHYQIIENEERGKSFQCIHCPKTYSKREVFQMHYYKIHKEKTLQCDKCEEKFSFPSFLKLHQKKCDGNKKQKTIRQKIQQKNYKIITSDGGQKFQCLKCPEMYSEMAEIQYHIRKHQEKKHKCDQCSKMFWRKIDLENHSKKCDGILKERRTKMKKLGLREKNYKIVTSENGKEFQCLKCPEIFAERLEFSKHNRKHQEKKNKCDLCSKLFWNRKSAENHIKKCDGMVNYKSKAPLQKLKSKKNPRNYIKPS